MDNLELARMANEVRKGIVTAVARRKKPDIPADLFRLRIFLHIFILKR